MNRTYLGIDCGTQGTKALLIDANCKALGKGYAPHQLLERPTGAREQEPAWWVAALRTAVTSALAGNDVQSVKAIGVSGQQHGLVVLDEKFQVIRPAKLWCDTETAPENAELIEMFGGRDAFFRRFGLIPLTGYTVSKLMWLKKHEPSNFARIRHVLLPHEYLNFFLTGQLCAEFGDASGTAFFDVRTRTWIREILDAIDGGTGQLFAALPPLLSSNDIVGKIRPEIATEFGLDRETVVSTGGGDNMMGAIGTGNVRAGMITMSLGTSSTVYAYREEPANDPTGCVAPFCASSGGWMPLVCTMNATNVVMQTLALVGKTVQDIDTALAKTDPGADGLTMLPFLNGERTPDLPKALGSLYGMSANNFTTDHLIRAAVEGVSFGVLRGLDMILEGEQASHIRLIGGGARSAAWRQLLADAANAIIDVPVEEEASCLGAAMQAIYAEAQYRGEPESFEDLAARCVKLDTGKTAMPDAGKRAGYAAAIGLYRTRLKEAHGV